MQLSSDRSTAFAITSWVAAALAVTTIASEPAGAAVDVGPITNPANGHEYYRLTANTWTGAEAEAVSLGGHLVTVNDQAENDWLVTTFASFNNLYWIGLNDAAVEGDFRWVSGETAAYRNWYNLEPQPNNDHVVLLTDVTREWLTWPESSPRQSFVEVVPEPAGVLPLAGAVALLTRRRRGR